MQSQFCTLFIAMRPFVYFFIVLQLHDILYIFSLQHAVHFLNIDWAFVFISNSFYYLYFELQDAGIEMYLKIVSKINLSIVIMIFFLNR